MVLVNLIQKRSLSLPEFGVNLIDLFITFLQSLLQPIGLLSVVGILGGLGFGNTLT